ncbi:hypothetical protein GCM10025875_32020 [Litorihabitans aurantiacus]|uniref:Uncharacterized protein n=1 Tax=Litorihabitans aurantiacus TaxID=1930061 RepID=A0AA37XH62_9MICO|nr:hypothetical protein GCM10025875_32020 [Litorihabitans aurantiacus]
MRVGTRRRVRRTLPTWMELTHRTDVPAGDVTRYQGVAATTVRRALLDVRGRMPPDRWEALVGQALRRALIDEHPAAARPGGPA